MADETALATRKSAPSPLVQPDRQPSPDDRSVFFDRLFALDPEVERLFPRDLTPHKRKFMQMLVLLINALDEPGRFTEMARKLGERHFAYGVQPHHYRLAHEALLWAVEQTMDCPFTVPVREAWAAFCDSLIDAAVSAKSE